VSVRDFRAGVVTFAALAGFVGGLAAFAPAGAVFEPATRLAVELSGCALDVFLAAAGSGLAGPAGLPAPFGREAASLAAAASLTTDFAVDLAGLLGAAFAAPATLAALLATGAAVFAPGDLGALPAATGTGFADTLAAAGGFFFGTAAGAAGTRAGPSAAAVRRFDEPPAALATAAFAGTLEAFAFTAAPLLVSPVTTFFGTIGLSCRGESDRR